MKDRLDKIICDSGIGTRKDIKKMIVCGRVSVNGKVIADPGEKLDRDDSVILVDGHRINTKKYRYFMMNKPAGVLTATEDIKQKTVLELLSEQDRRIGLFPAGRLDKDTTGLLILTNDGDFAHKIISPVKHVNKKYQAVVDGNVTDSDIIAFAEGLVLKDGTECQPALLEKSGENTCCVTIHEGKYHQVKRMLAAVGKPVISLHRISIGGLQLDASLSEGDYREMNEQDMVNIFIQY